MNISTAIPEKRGQLWGLKLVFYLLLGGVGAGIWIVTAILGLVYGDRFANMSVAGAWLALLAVGIGSLVLLGDLGVPHRAWRLAANAGSMITIGVVILSSFLLVTVICLSFSFAVFPWHGNFMARQVVSIIGIVLAVAVAAYTGLLLGVVKARPFWNTPLLPVLWIVSSISGGLAIATLLSFLPGMNLGDVQTGLKAAEISFLGFELMMIAFYLLVMHNSSPTAKKSTGILLNGRLSFPFWAGVVGLGLLLPLVLYGVNANDSFTRFAAVMVLVGAFFLRYTFLFAGLRTLLPGEPIEASYVNG